MHLGRFHKTISFMRKEFEELNPIQLLQNVESSLNAAANNPGNQEIANAYKQALELCRTTLSKSSLNTPRPITEGMLEALGAKEYIGNALFKRIISAITSDHAAPALVAQSINLITQDVQQFYSHITNLNNAFKALNVEYDDLNTGEGEIGLLIPKDENSSSLKDLSKECNQWHIALSTISEVFDTESKCLRIKTCSTTDWMFYLTATPPTLFGVSFCIKGVNSILKELLTFKELIQQLIESKASPEAIEILEAQQSTKLSDELRTLAELTVEKYYKEKDNRSNELKNALSQALKVIAEKISTGSKIEIRLIPPTADSTDKEEENEFTYLPDIDDLYTLADSFDNDIDAMTFNGNIEKIKGILGEINHEENTD